MPLTHDAFLEAFRNAEAIQREGRFGDAAQAWKSIAAAAPDSAQTWHKLGGALFELGQYADAEACLRAAVTLRPETFWANYSLGTFLHQTGRWAEAEAPYRRGLAAADHPALRTDLGLLLLGLGRFPEGWALYESRKALPDAEEPLDQPTPWNGEPLEGRRLLIWPEQGFGDQIQFARLAPLLQSRGVEVILVAPPPLVPLFAELPVKVMAQRPNLTVPKPDFWVAPASIPHNLDLELADIDPAPYLHAPAAARAKWAGHAQPGSIGYAWRGKAHHDNDRRRSMAGPEVLLGLLKRTRAHLVDLTDPLGDFADMAAVIEQLDLVITVDTAVAHLAGALGKPCWVMLPWFGQDWRWMQGRNDSPWYANTRLYRQPAQGDWAAVMQAIGQDLITEGWLG